MGILDDLLRAESAVPISQSSARWRDEPPPWAVVLHNIQQFGSGVIRKDLFLIKQTNGGWWYLSADKGKPLVSSHSFAYGGGKGWSWDVSDVISYEIMEHPFTGKEVQADTINGFPVVGMLLDFDQDDPDEALMVKTMSDISFYVKSESIRLAF